MNMRVYDANDEELLLCCGVLFNFLAELGQFDLRALSYATELVLIINGPLPVVLDAVLRDFHCVDLDAHDTAHGVEVELLNFNALLLLGLHLEAVLRPDLLVQGVFSISLLLCQLLLSLIEEESQCQHMKADKNYKIHIYYY